MLTEDNPSIRIAGQYFAALHPALGAQQRIELRYKAARRGRPDARAFVPSIGEATELAASYAETHEVYAGAATRLGEDGTKKGVCRAYALWADLDAKDGHTRESRLEQLLSLGCRPSMLVWTGGGFHAYWLLETRLESPQELEQAEIIMRLLAAGLDSDPVYDRSRIMRVPGTFNHKYGEPRPVEMELYEPDRRYELGQLRDLAESLPGATGEDNGSGGKVPREVLGEPIREHHRNVSLTSVAGSLRDRGLDAETICVVLLYVNRLRCVPPLGDEEVAQNRPVGRRLPGRESEIQAVARQARSHKKTEEREVTR